jgi:hypothetical protein
VGWNQGKTTRRPWKLDELLKGGKRSQDRVLRGHSKVLAEYLKHSEYARKTGMMYDFYLKTPYSNTRGVTALPP